MKKILIGIALSLCFLGVFAQSKNTQKVIGKYMYIDGPGVIIEDMVGAATDGYSGFFLIKLTRRNDGTDTYAGEIALMGADCHFQADRMGSYNTTSD